jgi:hypothetical protein
MERRTYIEFLISTGVNYTGSYLADHLSGVSYDQGSDFLQSEKITVRDLWELVKGLIQGSRSSYLIIDDSV